MSAHRIHIAGTDVTFAAALGDNLLRAGLRAGLGLPYECNAGGCGSCKFELVHGEVTQLWSEAPGLSAKDRQRGRRLACQCIAKSDCEIKIRPSDAFVARVLPHRFDATYLGCVAVTADIREFRFQSAQPARFAPGQYALVTLPDATQARAYSMSNQPNDEGVWAFMVRRVPGGQVSPQLFDALQPGSKVSIDGPLGFAHWREDSPRGVVCIAGGSGIAPVLSIANAVARSAAAVPLWLFYGGRTQADIPQFGSWLHDSARVQVHAALSADTGEASAWKGPRGFIHEVVAQSLPGEHADHEYYLAGPPPMIETTVRMLIVERKVPASQIHYDRFF